jgi:AraC-like DNA-binding protein
MLSELMEKQKPFKNSDLNIAELSEMLNTRPHILSKILNEHYNKNFRDFINGYRVEEFINISKSIKYKNYTFLALAHEAGFNSKSTFNLAFKKVTKLSPSEYLKKKHNIIID